MTWKQFQSWQAYDKIDPIGGARLDTLVASIVSTLVNLHRNTEKYPNPFPIADFVLKWGEASKFVTEPAKPVGKTWQQLKLIGQICAAAYNITEEEERRKSKRKKRG